MSAYLLAAAVAVVAFTADAAILAWWNDRR